MDWIVLYIVLGVVVTLALWFYLTIDKHNKQHEGNILIFFSFGVFLWPICIGGICYEIYKYLTK